MPPSGSAESLGHLGAFSPSPIIAIIGVSVTDVEICSFSLSFSRQISTQSFPVHSRTSEISANSSNLKIAKLAPSCLDCDLFHFHELDCPRSLHWALCVTSLKHLISGHLQQSFYSLMLNHGPAVLSLKSLKNLLESLTFKLVLLLMLMHSVTVERYWY